MKITTFDPIIVTKQFDEVVGLFEALGFEKKHAPVTDTGERNVRSFRMKHPEGYHVDVADSPDAERDLTYIRMNVDNFDEAYDIFMAHGFTNPRGDGTIDSKSSKAATLIAPSGFRMALVQHIKDHD
jgi:hypothetical protein